MIMPRFLLTLLGFLLAASSLYAESRIISSFDEGWLFYKGAVRGAEAVSFDDSGWRALNVPHDWSIEGPFASENPTGPGGGFLPCRRRLSIANTLFFEEYAGRRVFIEFDGIMANSDVWINGAHLGKRPMDT